MMRRLGLTGSIATGKSTVLKVFADLGVPIVSADEAVHQLYAGDAVGPVGEIFPEAIVGGVVDRVVLSRLLGAQPDRIRKLEAVVHPLVRKKIADFMRKAEVNGHDIAVVEVPLLLESGYDYGFDAIVVTYCDPIVQRERALSRPGMNVEKLDAILARQLSQADKLQRADYSLDTGKPIEATRREVAELVAALK